jgi:predicted glycosyltransferase
MSQGAVTIQPKIVDLPLVQVPGSAIPQLIPSVPVLPSKQLLHGKTIWIDIDNSPHVPFFLPIIEELKNRGAEVVLTARDIYQVCELLEFFKLPCKVIGGHYGKNKVLKVLGNCMRAAQLIPTAAARRPTVALSHGSRAQILACKALGIPTIMMHDYEHSTKTGFVEPDWTFMPNVIPDGVMSKQSGRTLKYPGLKEDVYVPRFRPDESVLDVLGISPNSLLVTLRPPATEAHYHNPEAEELFAETLRLLAETPNTRAVALPRNGKQGAELRKQWADLIARGSLIIPETPVDGLNLIWFSDLVVSGGGTMNREAAALGVPVYSVFRGKIGAVDKYLAENGRLTLLESVKDVRTKINLVRWNRPAKPENTNRPALQSIVDNIAAILEGKCPASPSLA